MDKFEVKDGVAIIPEGTTEIGEDAFNDCYIFWECYNPRVGKGDWRVCIRRLYFANYGNITREDEGDKLNCILQMPLT